MTVNLIKLCVGVSDVTQLIQEHERLARQALKRKTKKPVEDHHWTRMRPKRDEDVLDGGSLFWVIRGMIRVRHRILRLDDVTDADGQAYCAIIYDPKVILWSRGRAAPSRAGATWRRTIRRPICRTSGRPSPMSRPKATCLRICSRSCGPSVCSRR